jgi:hypothetical protein
VIDLEALEAESRAMTERSVALAQLLDAGHPVVERPVEVLAESRRLGAVAAQARRIVATRIALGQDPGCPVGLPPAVRRVRTDWKGNDLDPLHGRAAVTPELLAYWTHRRDAVAPAVEATYREALAARPYRQALVSACHGHLELLRQRRAMLSEAGDTLETALRNYDAGYENIRLAALDTQQIAVEAENRLANLRQEQVALLVPDTRVKGYIASTISGVVGLPTDPSSGMPIQVA